MGDVVVAAGNEPQQQMWDGDDGAFWVAHEAQLARMSPFDDALFRAAAVQPGEAVLDVGCGTGQTTLAAAARSGHGPVLGLDLSAVMLDRARAHAAEAGRRNVEFLQADAQIHRLPAAAFDLAISRMGVMFFSDPVAAFGNVAAALRPGGRFAFVVWQGPAANEWILTMAQVLAGLSSGPAPMPPPGSPGPFQLADPGTATDILTRAGFTGVTVTPVTAAMTAGATPEEATGTMAGFGIVKGFLAGLDPTDRERTLDRLTQAYAQHQTARGVELGAAAWVLTGRRPG